MKLHLQNAAGLHVFTAYGEGYVAVDGVRHEESLIVLPERLITRWSPPAPATLSLEHFSDVADLGLEILLLGTGSRLIFPSPLLIRDLAQQGIGLEAMDSFAACRTYNILAAEGRQVAAALILEVPTGNGA